MPDLFFSCFVAIKIAVFVEIIAIIVSVEVLGPAGVLFNDILGDLDFKLTILVLKFCWFFSSETNLTRVYNFISF